MINMATSCATEDSSVFDFVCEPLDKLEIEVNNKKGIRKKVSALNVGFVEKRKFVKYKPPIFNSEEIEVKSFLINEWLERIGFIEEDLHWLLKLPHHRFWSQVVYYDEVCLCLESYISNAPRYFDFQEHEQNDDVNKALERLHRLVFFVFLRMSTFKESKSAHITPKVFGEIIYDNYLFDIPKIFDLCVLYSRQNHALVHKMVANIFSCQPSYMNDLSESVTTILQVLDKIQDALGLITTDEPDHLQKAKKLGEPVSPCVLNQMSWTELEDIVYYIIDTSATMSAFLDIYLPACNVFHKKGATLRIANFYEAVFPSVYKEIKIRVKKQDTSEEKITHLFKTLDLAKSCFLKSFRDIVVCCCIQPILETSSSKENSKESACVEELLEIMSNTVEEKRFICDYQQVFPFEEDIEMLSQTSFLLDSTRTDYILSSIYSTYELIGEIRPQFPNSELKQKSGSDLDIKSLSIADEKIKVVLPEEQSTQSTLQSANAVSSTNDEVDYSYLDGACAAPRVEGEELDCLISKVLDLFPDLGAGFIEHCLDYFNYDVEKLIHSLLENQLPETFDKLDRQMTRSKKPEKESVLKDRRNVFDNDEFDVFSKGQVDMSRVHQGKRETKSKNFIDLEKDTKHNEVVKEVCKKYTLGEEGLSEDFTLYEDEYDDTYDSTMIGMQEPPQEDELTSRRSFVVPQVLRSKEDRAAEPNIKEKYSNGYKEEEEEEEKRRDEFVENPEVVRERAEQKRQQKHPFNARTNNVIGRPRGQGQDDETKHNRQHKDRHKNFSANHNRKSQSTWKRRGMFS